VLVACFKNIVINLYKPSFLNDFSVVMLCFVVVMMLVDYRVGAWTMMASTLRFLFAQLPLLPGHELDGPQAALSGGIVASIGLLAYCAYQVSFLSKFA